MPSKDHDVDGHVDSSHVDDRPRDRPRRSKSERKDRDRDGERDRDREHRRHRSHRTSKGKLSEGSETHSHSSGRRHRKVREKGREDRREHRRDRAASTSDIVTDIAPKSVASDRISLPYPTLSRAHAKEAIQSRESLSIRLKSNPLTPEATDVGDDDNKPSKSAEFTHPPAVPKETSRPPSPPETEFSADKRPVEEPPKEEEEGLLQPEPGAEIARTETAEGLLKPDPELHRSKSRTSSLSRSASRTDVHSRTSRRSASSSQATYVRSSAIRSREKLRSESRASSSSRHSTKRTSSVRSLKKADGDGAESSPSSAQDSSPKTPTQTPQFPPTNIYNEPKPETPSVIDVDDVDSDLHSKTATPATGFAPPPPPPPPPPPVLDLQDIPRVDYLLQNGGLPYTVPRTFLSVLPRQNGTRPSNPPLAGADTLFAPFFNLLDQYSTVVDKHGSIAVATGHRSIARRLLDRLENVFSRDLPAHGCSCIMCERSHEIHRGLTWGDVLEWVSGRIELPPWPPFDLADIGNKAAEISAEEPPRPASPVKLDPDIAEEFREHYLRQSKKVRSAVDKWLSSTGETPVPPPQEVDDETLAFAILTSLDPEDRPVFNAYLNGSRELKPVTRAPTPFNRPRTDFLIKTGLSLQRLYRLAQTPRDVESAMYLIKNPHTHDLLVTLSNINKSEWEILISGRFDGFLWSGADDDLTPGIESRGTTPASSYFHTRTMSPGSRAPSGFGSRTTTPFSSIYSRGPTPASFVSLASSTMPGARAPVSNDEEMEIAAITEIEREIYKGMEYLEDSFEKLHHRAEVVRTALRQRQAGLMLNLQNRRRIDVLPNPSSGNSQNSGYERPAWALGSEGDGPSEDEWAFDDIDIMPDDSASNISSSRHRRPKRRTERRTPAPIDEEDED